MKKYILPYKIINTIFIVIFVFIINASAVFAWDDCPLGEVNDPYPGDCGRYTDTDKNGICDHSEPNPNEKNIELAENDIQVNPIEKVALTENKINNTPGYNFFSLTISIIFLYFLSYFSSKKKLIEIKTHKKIWNFLLLFTFLVSGLLGILLVLKIDYNIIISLPFNILSLHVEAGIAMAVISFFHILERIKCFKI